MGAGFASIGKASFTAASDKHREDVAEEAQKRQAVALKHLNKAVAHQEHAQRHLSQTVREERIARDQTASPLVRNARNRRVRKALAALSSVKRAYTTLKRDQKGDREKEGVAREEVKAAEDEMPEKAREKAKKAKKA